MSLLESTRVEAQRDDQMERARRIRDEAVEEKKADESDSDRPVEGTTP